MRALVVGRRHVKGFDLVFRCTRVARCQAHFCLVEDGGQYLLTFLPELIEPAPGKLVSLLPCLPGMLPVDVPERGLTRSQPVPKSHQLGS